MVELKRNELVFSFPEVHPEARLRINFQHTLRIPDDDSDYPLPPGLGCFPLKHVDDFRENLPADWIRHGGVMLPMYQSEAMWLDFETSYISEHDAEFPFAIKIATGKIDAVTGKQWANHLRRGPQDYLVVPGQPWLDGYCVDKGIIRQFVAMPLGPGYTAEEQLTGHAEHGGLQIAVYPMKRTSFEKYFPITDVFAKYSCSENNAVCPGSMGLAPGGKMRQEIYEDQYRLNDWDQEHYSRCFVHIANSIVWRAITDENPPTVPPTAKEYTAHGLPWYEYYSENDTALPGGENLTGIKSVGQLATEKGDNPLPENESVNPHQVIQISKNVVREGDF